MTTATATATGPTDRLTLEAIRTRLDSLIHRGFRHSETTLIEALPATGKSYGVVKWAAQTGKPLTVFAPRYDILEEYEQRCEELGLSVRRLPSFFRDCDSFDANSDPVNYAAESLKREYHQGRSGVALHAEHSNLPCQREGECSFVEDRDFEAEEYSVLLGTYRHAYREKWIEGRYVAFDEFPGDAFLTTFEDGIAPIVSAYLEDNEERLPFRDYIDFLSRKGSPAEQERIEKWRSTLSTYSYDYQHARDSPNSYAHALAPTAILALIEMEPLDNNWQYSDLGYGRIAVRNPKNDAWTFLLPPDLNGAESVMALDGTPNETLWGVVLNEEIQTFTLLDAEERQEYLRDVLGYRFIQTTENWKAIQGGDGASPPKDLALIEGIAQREDQEPALITSQRAKHQYAAKGLDKLTDTVEHYSNLKGMNKFGTERVGVVLGNAHPGDHEVQKWAALAGDSAERKEIDGRELTGTDTDYGPFGNEVMHTLVHNEVLQAAMRFGREKENGVLGATVYLHTSALPSWLPVEKQNARITSWLTEKNGVKQTIEAIRSLDAWEFDEWSATQLYDCISVTKHRVRDCLDDLVDAGYINFEGKWGQGSAKHYSNIRLEDAGEFGHVEFGG